MIDPAEDGITAKVVHTKPALVHIFLHMSTETSGPKYNFTLFVPLDEFSPRERQLTARVTRFTPRHSKVAGWYERRTRRHLLVEPLDLATQLLRISTRTFGKSWSRLRRRWSWARRRTCFMHCCIIVMNWSTAWHWHIQSRNIIVPLHCKCVSVNLCVFVFLFVLKVIVLVWYTVVCLLYVRDMNLAFQDSILHPSRFHNCHWAARGNNSTLPRFDRRNCGGQLYSDLPTTNNCSTALARTFYRQTESEEEEE